MRTLSRLQQFVISLFLTSVGIGLGGYGGRVMIDRMSGVGLETRLDTSGVAIFAAGAVCFAFGVMWLLTVLVRPFFEKRAVDRHVEEWTERQRPR
ncbi:MAG: hypothetical protein U0Q55_14245 [Vicinamibacterales bacterium]